MNPPLGSGLLNKKSRPKEHFKLEGEDYLGMGKTDDYSR